MYFINIKKLKQDIIEDKFTQKDRFLYAFIWIILNEIIMISPDFYPSIYMDVTYLDKIVDLINIVIIALGTFIMYKYNGANKGKDFVDRYFAITFVISFRVLLLVVIFMMFTIGVLYAFLPFINNIANIDKYIDYIFYILLIFTEVYIYYRSATIIKTIANLKMR
jgi:hypothetical protein